MDRTSQMSQKGLAGFLWPGMEEKVSQTFKVRELHFSGLRILQQAS